LKPWKDFSEKNLVFSEIEKYLEKSAFSFGFQRASWRTPYREPFGRAKKMNRSQINGI